MRLVFMGSPREVIPTLESIISLCHQTDHELAAVVSQPAKVTGRSKKLIDPPLADFAKNQGLPVLQPAKASDLGFLSQLAAIKPDVVITAAYGQILSDSFLKVPSRATINIHPSLLPKYRGATPVPAALIDGEEKTGITILFTIKPLDAGNIILQEEVIIDPMEKTSELRARLFRLGGARLSGALTKLEDPLFSGIQQDHDSATICKKMHKDDGLIDWNRPNKEIFNRYRAHFPWPGSYTELSQKGRLILTELAPLSDPLSDETQLSLRPGEFIFSKAHQAFLVGTKDGILSITMLKPAGAKEMNAASFWNGLKSKSKGRFE